MRQKWGQNFLVNPGVSTRIVSALGAGPSDSVLEIGPGRGALTSFLVGKVHTLTVVELDRALAAALSFQWEAVKNFSVINQDFLEWPLPPWPLNSVKILGNLPYSAANPIINRLLNWNAWEIGVVMVQKEVAERIAASPGGGDYGILSLAVQSRAQVEILFDVPPSCFSPRPQIMSSVLRLRRRALPLFAQEDSFFRVVRAAFGQRRKTLANSLSHGLALEKDAVHALLDRLGINPHRRAETVSLEDFNQLAEFLSFDAVMANLKKKSPPAWDRLS
jgi:16S rRNA (adenine1518-N6/adenine1519-N6)-dimethyltransferase